MEMDDVTHWDLANDGRLRNTIIGNNVNRQVLHSSKSLLNLSRACH